MTAAGCRPARPGPRAAAAVAFAALAADLASCSVASRDTLAIAPRDPLAGADPAALAADARAAFARTPRTTAAVREAARTMAAAAVVDTGDRAELHARLVDAVRYHAWLARHAGADAVAADRGGGDAGVGEPRSGDRSSRDPDASPATPPPAEHRAVTGAAQTDPVAGTPLEPVARDAAALAIRALEFANTAVELDPSQASGFYWRAVAIGLVAAADSRYGLDAMERLQADARRALELDDRYEAAGAHRVLGALYLEAPGPPLGPGSLRRARFHLRNAVAIAPDDPGNLTFLARALAADDGDPREIAALAARATAAAQALDDPAERAYWLERIPTP